MNLTEHILFTKAQNKIIRNSFCVVLILLSISCKKENTIVKEQANKKADSLEKIVKKDTIAVKNTKIADGKTQSFIKISYAGKIDRLPVQMELNINKTTHEIDGSYRYVNSKSEQTIYLKGKLNGTEITLNETVYQNQKHQNTGSFILNFSNAQLVKGSWKNPSETKSLTVNLTSRENFENQPFLFTFEAKTKTYQVETYPGSENKVERCEVENVKIYHDKDWLQTITFKNTFIYDTNDLVTLEDLNFDGFYDLKIMEYFIERTKYDTGFRYFIYNPETKKFVENIKLNDLEYLTFNGFTKEFIKMYADGSGNESTHYYKWKGNDFKQVRKEEVTEENPKTVTTNYP